ncbi:glycosyltransferase family 2 protein [Cognatishimia activa]|uniref:Glycosyltransferase family 2 protein n=1 Tax=Cognatishimia activa TaxID=1715691 RepID=A0A975EMS4_9RHOB|nr:glycosyltransferase family A protein [Cognatishimia activa]QTN34923.1 glycosyltransferase family 2 protein [Cognatishimia activa]
MPKFSIIMPCFNAVDTVDATIAAVVAQTRWDWELICVDDGSSDGTVQRLQSWAMAEARIQVIRQDNAGPSVARNRGVEAARGTILCFCDADDLWVETKLSILDKAFSDSRIDGAYGQIAFFQRFGDIDTTSTVGTSELSIPELMGENPVCTMSNIAVRRTVFERCGGFAEGLVHNEDLEWLIRIVGMGATIQPIDRLLVWYRTSTGGLSADLRRMAHSRDLALTTAARFGFTPNAAQEAVYLRYLARRALRLDQGRGVARGLALQGLLKSPRGFLFPLRRGAATAIAAFAAPLLPAPVQRKIFSK